MRKRLVAVLFVGLSLGSLVVPSAQAATTPEARAAQLVNESRARAGLRKLVRTATLDEVAERQAKRMRARGELYHSNLSTTVPGSWRLAGENVGYAGAVKQIHVLFMDSPGHRQNILRPVWDQMGIGIVRDADGTVWEAQVFVDR